jgi:hypothetical protein
MDDLPEKLRQHYLSQSLPPATVERILAAGRRRFRRRLAGWSVAAALTIAASCVGYRYATQTGRSLETRSVEMAMEDFFRQPEHPIARVSTDLPGLRLWLNQHGAPADAVVPAAFSKLPAFGCHVLKVGGESVYLLCFILEAGTGHSLPAMKKPPTLVHFVSVPLKAFKTPPVAGDPVMRTGGGDWKFAEWRSGDVVYITGGEVPLDRLQQLMASL